MKRLPLLIGMIFLGLIATCQSRLILANGDTMKTEITRREGRFTFIRNPEKWDEELKLPNSYILTEEELESLELEFPFKGANKIVILNEKTFDENYIGLGRLFISAGFTIDQKDKDFGFISTKPFENYNLAVGSFSYFYKANIFEGKIELTSWLLEDYRIEYGTKGLVKIMEKPWEKMIEIANQLSHTKILFVKEK